MRPDQGVVRLSPEVSWDRLQLPPATLFRIRTSREGSQSLLQWRMSRNFSTQLFEMAGSGFSSSQGQLPPSFCIAYSLEYPCGLCGETTFQDVEDKAKDVSTSRGWSHIHLIFSQRNCPCIAHCWSVRCQVLQCQQPSWANKWEQMVSNWTKKKNRDTHNQDLEWIKWRTQTQKAMSCIFVNDSKSFLIQSSGLKVRIVCSVF